MNASERGKKVCLVEEIEMPTTVEELVNVLFKLGMKKFGFKETKFENDKYITTLMTTWEFAISKGEVDRIRFSMRLCGK